MVTRTGHTILLINFYNGISILGILFSIPFLIIPNTKLVFFKQQLHTRLTVQNLSPDPSPIALHLAPEQADHMTRNAQISPLPHPPPARVANWKVGKTTSPGFPGHFTGDLLGILPGDFQGILLPHSQPLASWPQWHTPAALPRPLGFPGFSTAGKPFLCVCVCECMLCVSA